MSNRKAQGLSLNVIVVATLAILVLVIVSVIFMGRMMGFTRGSNDCADVNGECMDRQCDEGYTRYPGKVCYGSDGKPDDYAVCCTEMSGVN